METAPYTLFEYDNFCNFILKFKLWLKKTTYIFISSLNLVTAHNFAQKIRVAMPPVESLELKVESSECCKIPKTNRDFWVAKIRRNQERDMRVQHELAAMGWHSITIWECELKPSKREQTLLSLVYTLSHIWMKDNTKPYSLPEDELSIAAEGK